MARAASASWWRSSPPGPAQSWSTADDGDCDGGAFQHGAGPADRSPGQAHDDRDAERGGQPPLARQRAGRRDTDPVTASAATTVDPAATAILAPGDPAEGCRPVSGRARTGNSEAARSRRSRYPNGAPIRQGECG